MGFKRYSIILLLFAMFMRMLIPLGHSSSDIVIDGDPSDWTAHGLSPVGTDPPYNEPHTYNPVTSDLLEAWACKNDSMLFLMMKVRGGWPEFDKAYFTVNMNVDPQGNTGNQFGVDYFITLLSASLAPLFPWNTTTSAWGDPSSSSRTVGKASALGYIEWGIPLNEIGGDASDLKLVFFTHDKTFDSLVNSIEVSLSPPITIPEFPLSFILPLFIVTTLVSVTLYNRFDRAA